MTLRFPLLVLVVVPLAACKKDYPQCDRFVDLAMKCDGDMKAAPSGEQDTTRAMMASMCHEAFRNDTSSVSGEARELVTEIYAELRERADCTASASTCEQFSKCTESETN